MSLVKMSTTGIAEKVPTLMTVTVTVFNKSKTTIDSLAGLSKAIEKYLQLVAKEVGLTFVETTPEERKVLPEVFNKSERSSPDDKLATYYTSGVSTRQSYTRNNPKGVLKKDGYISSIVYNFMMEVDTGKLVSMLNLNTSIPDMVGNTTYGFAISEEEQKVLNAEARKAAFSVAEERAELYKELMQGTSYFLSVLSEMPNQPSFSYHSDTADYGVRKSMSASQQETLSENITIENIVKSVTLYFEYEVTGN